MARPVQAVLAGFVCAAMLGTSLSLLAAAPRPKKAAPAPAAAGVDHH